MVSYDLAILRDAAEAVSRLGRDQIRMNAYVTTVATLPLPAKGSAAAQALSCRAEVVSYTRGLVLEIERQLTTLAQNLRDTADAYQRGEAENVIRTNRFGDDGPERDKLDLDGPSRRLTDPVELVEPSLLPQHVLDLAAFVTGIPDEVADFMMLYFRFLLVVTPGEQPDSNEWAKAAMGQYGPISKVGNGYRQLGKAYFELGNQFEQIGDQLKHGWTGDTAELAAGYFQVVLNWIRSDAAQGLDFIGSRYENAACALHRNAAHAATAISGYQDALQDLVEDLRLFIAQNRTPTWILWQTISKAAAVVAKKFFVVNTTAKLLQVVGNLLEDFYTRTPIACGEVHPPKRA